MGVRISNMTIQNEVWYGSGLSVVCIFLNGSLFIVRIIVFDLLCKMTKNTVSPKFTSRNILNNYDVYFRGKKYVFVISNIKLYRQN